MTNEWKEFKAYTEPVNYTSAGKRDTSYLGRMTFETITDYVGMSRILTVIARGYLFHNSDGNLKDGDPYENVEYAREALCAWCSVPDKKKESDPAVDFGYLAENFPELVNENGEGWYWKHVKNVIRFVKKHLDLTSVNAQKTCEKISGSFTREWQKQVRKYQVPIFALNTKGAWTLRFDDILADALEAGPLRTEEYTLPEDIAERLTKTNLNEVPFEVVSDVICFCLANRQEYTEWVVLPVGNFDAYYGNTYFSRKWLCRIPESILERSPQKCGVCRVKVK